MWGAGRGHVMHPEAPWIVHSVGPKIVSFPRANILWTKAYSHFLEEETSDYLGAMTWTPLHGPVPFPITTWTFSRKQDRVWGHFRESLVPAPGRNLFLIPRCTRCLVFSSKKNYSNKHIYKEGGLWLLILMRGWGAGKTPGGEAWASPWNHVSVGEEHTA